MNGILVGEIITDKLNQNFLSDFYIEKVETEVGRVVFHMEDTYNFIVWLLDFEISYILKHFPNSTPDQVIISAFDFDKIYKYIEKVE